MLRLKFYPPGDANEIMPLREIVRVFSLWNGICPLSAHKLKNQLHNPNMAIYTRSYTLVKNE